MSNDQPFRKSDAESANFEISDLGFKNAFFHHSVQVYLIRGTLLSDFYQFLMIQFKNKLP